MDMTFLLDTSVLSETGRKTPHPSVIQFIETADNLMIPIGTLVEFQLGIVQVCGRDPIKAVKLSAWYHKVLSAGIPIAGTNENVAQVWGTLLADPRLRNLAHPRPDAKRFWGGQDLHIAAAAIVHRCAIATLNVKDFMLINSFYPLPGVYNPIEEIWHARMDPIEWPEIDEVRVAANGDRLGDRQAVDARMATQAR